MSRLLDLLCDRSLVWMAFLAGLAVYFGACPAFAVSSPVPFVPQIQGAISPYGFSGFYDSPARYALNGFGFSGFGVLGLGSSESSENVDQYAFAAFGDVGREWFRVGFYSSYLMMDSLYRQSYSELDMAWTTSVLVLGGGYGYSLEWIPRSGNLGGDKWGRHRYKAGALLAWSDFFFGATACAFVGDVPDVRGGIHWIPQGRFSAFVEVDRNGAFVGNSVRFSHGNLRFAYRFPDFSVAVAASVNFGGWHGGASCAPGTVPVLGAFLGKMLEK